MSKTAAAKEDVLIGRIVGTHGLRGNCRLHSYAESLSVFEPESRLRAILTNGFERQLRVRWVKAHARGALISLEGISDYDQAEALVGADLYVERSKLPEPTDGSYYWIDLIGLPVYTVQEEYLGKLESIIETGSNDVYVVKNEDREILIPALESVIRVIDLQGNRMEVDLPEGL